MRRLLTIQIVNLGLRYSKLKNKTHLSVAFAEAAIQAGFVAYFMTADVCSPISTGLTVKAGWIEGCGCTKRPRF
jgi:hypothetical protein